MREFIYILSFILLLIALLSCSNPNEVENTAITGKVILVGDKDTPVNELNDYSDVTISLYNLAVLDTTLVRLNREYPNIGVQIIQETEFDYRRSEPVKTVKPDSNGSFMVDRLTSGEYNLVVSKPNWGSRVLYNVVLSKANNTELDEIELYPVVELSMFINEPFVFQKNRTYIAKSDVTFGNNCVFEGKSQVLLGSNCNLNFTTVSSEGSIGYTRFDTLEESGQQWGGLNFTKSNTHLSNLQIRNSLRGVVFLADNSSLSSSIIENSADGSYLHRNNTNMQNNLFRKIESECIIFDPCANNSGVVEYRIINSIFYSCMIGVKTQGNAIRIANNYFAKNISGIYSFSGYHEICNNEFYLNEQGVVLTGSKIEIAYNKYYENKASVVFSSARYGGSNFPIIRNNNFYQTRYRAVEVQNQCPLVKDLDVTNNYWYSNNIEALFYDYNDYPGRKPEILYVPKASKPFEEAGIIK